MGGPYHGKSGTVTYNTSAYAEVQSWDLTTTADMADTTAMQASNFWSTQEAGLTDFNANTEVLSGVGFNGVAIMDTGGTLVLGASASSATLTGDALPTTLTETVSIEDVSKTSIAWDGNDNDGLTLA